VSDGEWAWLEVHAGVGARDCKNRPVELWGITFDITAELMRREGEKAERAKLFDELERSEIERAKKAYEITEHIPIGTYTMVLMPGETIGKFDFMSRRFLEITGLERQEAADDPLKAFECVHPEYRQQWIEKNAEAFSARMPFREEALLEVNGKQTWIVAESSPRVTVDGVWVWEGVIQDITLQKDAEQRLLLATEELVQAARTTGQYFERQKMLQDLHDGFANQLALAKLRLDRGASTVDECKQVISGCLDTLRDLYSYLEAPIVSFLELMLNIERRFSKELENENIGFSWSADLTEGVEFEPRQAIEISRILQESISNALRHANARTITVECRQDCDMISIVVQDDGKGFDQENICAGRGLTNMRRRADSQGWRLEMLTGPEKGTRIVLTTALSS